MMPNNNKTIIRTLAVKKIKQSKSRFWILLLAIIMTTSLISATLTVGSSLVESIEYTTMRQVGTKAHGGFKNLTPDEYHTLKNNPAFKQTGLMQTIGFVENPLFKTRSQQVFYMDETGMDFTFILPLLKGDVPKHADEVLVSTLTLDMLGLPHEVGCVIQGSLDMDGTKKNFTWTVSGIYKGDHLAMADLWVISEMLASQLLEGQTIAYNSSDQHYSGMIQMGVMVDRPSHTFMTLSQIGESVGLDNIEQRVAVNWGYSSSQINPQEIISFIILLSLLIFSGYLVIYSIFAIGIVHDIHFYGMLKTIGCTSKQIKRLVIYQGLYLSIAGIPIGLLVGYLVGRLTLTYMTAALKMSDVTFSIKPFIFIFAAILTLFTLYVSSSKPARQASKISPIEAIRTNEVATYKVKKNHPKNHTFSLFYMAKKNIGRYKKKALLVVLSLTISLTLLQTVTTALSAVDMDQMIDHMIAGDYTLGSGSLFDYSYNYRKNAVDKDILNTLSSSEGVTLNQVYGMTKTIVPSRNLLDAVNIEANTNDYDEIQLLERKQEVDLYGIDQGLYKYLEPLIVKGKFDSQKFNSGEGIIISKQILHFTDDGITYLEDIYKIGDTIDIPDESGIKHRYEIIAFVDEVPYYLYDGNSRNFGMNVYMSATAFEVQNENMPVMLASLTVSDPQKKRIATLLEDLSLTNPDFAYKSRSDYINELSSFDTMVKVIGYSLSCLLGLMAILNFVNTFISNIIARRKELAMLQSVGMTSKQVLTMLLIESCFQSILAVLLAFCIGGVLSKVIANNLMYTSGQFDFTPLWIVSPLVVIVLLLVPIIIYNNIMKETLVERLRRAD